MNSVQKLSQRLPPGLRRRLGDVRRRIRARAGTTRAAKEFLLADSSLAERERELLAQTGSRIFFNDGMYTGDGAHYFSVGLSAMRVIEEAVAQAELPDVRRILDLPCGGGRVLRFLTRRFPSAMITACDLQHDMVDFCAQTFGAEPFYSVPDLDALALGKTFDLVWCGSLVTHLDAAGIQSLLKFFRRHLAPNGLLLFTAHGDYVARERMPRREFEYGIADEEIQRITTEYARTGYAFADYPDARGYGVSLTSPAWIRALITEGRGLREIYFEPRGWDAHQDVFGFLREDEAHDSKTPVQS